MKRGRIRHRIVRIVITFLKLMLLTIAVVILAAVTITWYTAYVQKERMTETTSIMGAIITSQKVEKTRTTKFYSASTVAEFKNRGIDITETKYFTYKTIATADGGFKVTATSTDAFGAGGGTMTYTYDPAKGGRWGNDEPIILKNYQLLQT